MKACLYILGIAMILTSCKGMNDNIEEYLDRGEINYLGRPDSIQVRGGDNRIQFAWLVNEDPRITGSTIQWNDLNNEPQSVSFPVDRNSFSKGYMVTPPIDMEEGSYLFSVIHTGEKGYPSIPTEFTGQVYGDIFRSSLSPRLMTGIEIFPDRVEFNWAAADAAITKVLFTYETVSGEMKTVEVTNKTTKTTATDIKKRGDGGAYFWTTYYLPDPNAMDEFSIVSKTEFLQSVYFLDKTGWTATSLSNHPTWGLGPQAVIDGNHETYWHTPADLDDPARPYNVVIDMKAEKQINTIEVDKRLQITKVELQSSSDGSQWTVLGQIAYTDNGSNTHGIGTLTLDTPVVAQYLKCVILTSTWQQGGGSIWEIEVYGTD
jgi:hypothetical protein